MSQDTFENFKKSWMEEISKIENEAIDSEGVQRIYLCYDFGRHLLMARMNKAEHTREVHLELGMLESRLIVALETAVQGLGCKIVAFGLESLKVLAE